MIKRLLKLFHKKSKAGAVQTPAVSAGSAAANPVSASQPQGGSGKGKNNKKPVQHSESDGSGDKNKAAKFRRPRPDRHKKQQDKWDIKQFEVDPKEGENRFHDFDLPDKIMHAIADLGFKYCTPIQSQTLSHTMAGADAIGQAQTGTGKTAAFLITIIKHLLAQSEDKQRHGCPRSLIIAPTRELVMQIAEDGKSLAKYCPLNVCAVFGGMDYEKQQRAMEQQVDILVATPGRLIDFQRRRIVDLQRVKIMVIDEADRMLDMGFIPDVRRIVNSTPPREKRQTLMFSATMTPDVKRLASQWCKKPIYVKIESEDVTARTVEQIVYLATAEEKYAILYNIITSGNLKKVLVFTNRKDETRTLCQRLLRNNINCDMLSGDVAQKKRMTILSKFKDGRIEVLVATDVAGRGIHVDGISHVFNYVLPYEAEDYVHRIGRTGRAGHTGIAISFADEEAAFYLPAIEKLIDRKLECIYPDDELVRPAPRGTAPKTAGGRSSKKYPDKGRSSGGRRPSSRGHYRARPASSTARNQKQ
ncbi:MAG: ATP-dependent RNA helicase RhlB [Deltaproteobacteria bacterium]|nr:ATP-dependent RNA helicase RhlB [Deltaproteobacteria bacterium]